MSTAANAVSRGAQSAGEAEARCGAMQCGAGFIRTVRDSNDPVVPQTDSHDPLTRTTRFAPPRRSPQSIRTMSSLTVDELEEGVPERSGVDGLNDRDHYRFRGRCRP